MNDATITPTRPAHWLAENLDREAPALALLPIATAAVKGSHESANSAPHLMADSATFVAFPKRSHLTSFKTLYFFFK